MAHFVQLDGSNRVIQVIVVSNEALNGLDFPDSEPLGIAFCHSLFGEDTYWKQTSYNGNFRGNYAGPGYIYDPICDVFVSGEQGDSEQFLPKP